MKKILLFVFALLLIAGVCYADHVPTAVDAKNEPAVWTADVYNGSATAIASGTIAQWDFETSDSVTSSDNDDMCPWVITADAARDIWTAGVVPYGKNIAAYSPGAIIIRGPAYVLEHSTPPAANEICGSHTNGTVTTDAASANTSSLGITIDASPTGWTGYSIVYIDPTQEAD